MITFDLCIITKRLHALANLIPFIDGYIHWSVLYLIDKGLTKFVLEDSNRVRVVRDLLPIFAVTISKARILQCHCTQLQ